MKNLLITSRDLNINDEKYFSVDSSWFNYFEEYNLILAPNNLRDSKDIFNSRLQISLIFLCILTYSILYFKLFNFRFKIKRNT